MKYPCNNPNMCTNCEVCLDICAHGAISIIQNNIGNDVAIIDEKRCVNCRKCEMKCHINSSRIDTASLECYAATTKDEQTYLTTSSGGVATEISKYFIENNGVVYGSAFTNGAVKHIRSNDMNGLERMKGSKYVFSNTKGIWGKVKQDLEINENVLFIGTPCQVAALRSFLGKDFKNLYTIDLICHGTPPFSYLKEYVQKKTGEEINNVSDISFRAKNWELTIKKERKLVYSRINVEDPYMIAFSRGVSFRENCYSCKYANSSRVSNITIGDFWGIGEHNLEKSSVSLVIINNDKGIELWGKVQNRFDFEKRMLAEAYNGNSQLRKPSKRPKSRDAFLRICNRCSFPKALDYCGITLQALLMQIKHGSFGKKNDIRNSGAINW